jgi:MFS family permease
LSTTRKVLPISRKNLLVPLTVISFWLLVHPSSWRRHLQRIDPNLHPDFCLVDLTKEQRRNRRLWAFLAGEWLFLLLGLLIITSTYLLLNHTPQADAMRILARNLGNGFFGALAFSALVSTASGFIFGGVLGIGFVFMGLNDIYYVIALAAALGLSAAVHLKLSSEKTFRSLPRDVTGFIIGLIIITPLVLLIRSWFYGHPLAESPQTYLNSPLDSLDFSVFAATIFLGCIVLLFFALRLRTMQPLIQNWLIISIYALLFSLFVHVTVTNPTKSWQFLVGLAGGSTLYQGIIFSLAWSGSRRVGGGLTAATVAMLLTGIGSVAIAPTDLTGPIPPPTVLYTAAAISLFGLFSFVLRPILFSPVVVIYNHILFSLDQETHGKLRFFDGHAAFWDEFQPFRWPGLGDYLVLLAERQPEKAESVFLQLSEGKQHPAVRAAQIELNARRLESCQTITQIAQINKEIAGKDIASQATSLVRSFLPISLDIESALSQISTYHQRLSLGSVRDSLTTLQRDLILSKKREAQRLSIVAGRWNTIISEYIEQLARGAQSQAEIDNPYICGVPLNDQQEVFVGRTDIMTRIEHLLLSENCPPLLLYGQRRMGKTSLLLNISHILPSKIIPCFVDAQSITIHQDPITATQAIIATARESAWRTRSIKLPQCPVDGSDGMSLNAVKIWLDQTGALLTSQGLDLLVMIDEFEALGYPYKSQTPFTTDLMILMRHMLQHQSWFRIIFSGAHAIDELDRWSHFLINSQILKISYLEAHEALRLIEQPVRDFGLKHTAQTAWHILGLTSGHPYLLQALCFELVMLKNEQPEDIRHTASYHDIEEAAKRVFTSNRFFFADITNAQITPTARYMLSYLAGMGKGRMITADEWRQLFPENYQSNLNVILRRDLVTPDGPGFRFQVELIRRWFDQQMV